MKQMLFIIILFLCGCTYGHYPKEYAKYMENHNGKFEYDTLCTSNACKDARQYLVDYKLAKHEEEKIDSDEILEDFTYDTYEIKSLNQDCYKTLSKLIEDNYIGCKTNVQLPELSGEEKGSDSFGTSYMILNDNMISLPIKKRPNSRQCGIDMYYNFRKIVAYCKTDHWENNPDTQAYYKEMAEDGILQTGLIRPSFSFKQEDPFKKTGRYVCNTSSSSCEQEISLITDYMGLNITEAQWDDNLHRGFEESKYKNNEFDFELSDVSKERIEQLVIQIGKYLFRMAGAPIF